MTLIHTLNTWDTNLLLTLNGCHSAFFDRFMYAFSDKLTWIPLYAAVLYAIIKHWKRDAVWIILSFVLCIVFADQLSSTVIKDLVQRPRPSQAVELQGLVHLVNDYRGGRFGFVSSHAANSIGFALLSSLLFRQKNYTYVIFLWAVLTAYSRIYLGVHYPLDVVGGAVVGVLMALACFWALRKYKPIVLTQQSAPQTTVPLIVLGMSIVTLIVYGFIQ